MDIFGIGMPELFMILVLIMIFVGPERLPEMMRTVGGWVREIRGLRDEATVVWREAMEVPETIKSTVTQGTRASRGNPSVVTYVPPPAQARQQENGGGAIAASVENANSPMPEAKASLDYPAPFEQSASADQKPQDSKLDYPAPFGG